MSEFAINFDFPLQTVKVDGDVYAAPIPSEPITSVSKEAVRSEYVDSTLTAVGKALENLITECKLQQNRLHSTAVSYAIEIVRVLVASDEKWIEERLRANVERLLSPEDEVQEAKVYVHPECLDSIKGMLASGQNALDGLEILGDRQLVPGDCRIDFGQSGRLAFLEGQLRLIKTRMEASSAGFSIERER